MHPRTSYFSYATLGRCDQKCYGNLLGSISNALKKGFKRIWLRLGSLLSSLPPIFCHDMRFQEPCVFLLSGRIWDFCWAPFFGQNALKRPCNLYPTSWHSCQVPWVRFHFLAVKMWLEPCWSIAMDFLTMRIWAWKMNWSLGFVKNKYLFDRIDGGIIFELLFKK